MGIILSRVRKKKSTIEVLEKLDNDIKEIQESGANAQRKYKKITKLFLVCSVVLYVLCGIIFYFQFTSTLQGKLLYLVPLAISPLLLYIVKRIISWYFDRLLNKNKIRLNEMKKEKKKILDEVMDKETYKVAKEILEKFSDEIVPKTNYNVQMQLNKHDDGLRKRPVIPTSSPQFAATQINRGLSGSQSPRQIIPNRTRPGMPTPMMKMSAPMQLPAPILPLQRSYIDRVVEYLIGDGPNNRYALICSQCHSHNGMALKEEFEYIGFKCCYCFFFNPARKVRPEAPKLETPMILPEPDTDSERTSEENSDAEHKSTTDEKKISVHDSSQMSNVINDVDPSLAEKDSNELEKELEEMIDTSSPVEKVEEKIIENSSENSNQPESDANCDESLVKS